MRQYGEVELQGRSWVLRVQPHVAMKVKRTFARVSQERSGAISVVSTPEVCRDLEWFMTRFPLQITRSDKQALKAGSEKHRQIETAYDSVMGGAPGRPGVRTPLREPRDYQTKAADLVLESGRLLLVDDLGLGKTFTGLLTLKDEGTLPAVVVCQPHLQSQWMEQLKLTWGDLRGHIVKQTSPYDLSTVCDGNPPDVILISYSKLAGWCDVLAGEVKTVIFDEIQELRHMGTIKYESAEVLVDKAPYRVGLTATPIYNYGAETFSVVKVLDPDVLGNYWEFAREWIKGSKGQITEPKALGSYLRDQSLMLVRTRKDVGREITEPIRVPQHVDADPEVFENAKGDAMAMAQLILSATSTNKEKFLTAGELDARMRHDTGVAKAPFVAEFVRMLLETEEKVVLFGWHRDVYEIWLEQLAGFNPVLYTGSESTKQKDESKRRFLAPTRDEDGLPNRDASRILIMSLRSGAGVDGLQEVTSCAVFGELDWSPKVHDQCIGRLHRDGQTSVVAAYFCVSESGADPIMAQVNNLKEQEQNAIVHPDRGDAFVVADTSDRIKLLAQSIVDGAS